jgi:hypothetical protein
MQVGCGGGCDDDWSGRLTTGDSAHAALVALTGRSMDCSTAVLATGLWDRLARWANAQAMVTLTEAVRGGDLPQPTSGYDAEHIVAQELAVMTKVSFGTAMNRVAMVGQVAETLPTAWEALDRGRLTLAHVQALAKVTAHCAPRIVQLAEASVVDQAIARGWTPSALASAAQRALIAVDPDGSRDRAEQAKLTSDVRMSPAVTRWRRWRRPVTPPRCAG